MLLSLLYHNYLYKSSKHYNILFKIVVFLYKTQNDYYWRRGTKPTQLKISALNGILSSSAIIYRQTLFKLSLDMYLNKVHFL